MNAIIGQWLLAFPSSFGAFQMLLQSFPIRTQLDFMEPKGHVLTLVSHAVEKDPSRTTV